jgi:hypothetical protein
MQQRQLLIVAAAAKLMCVAGGGCHLQKHRCCQLRCDSAAVLLLSHTSDSVAYGWVSGRWGPVPRSSQVSCCLCGSCSVRLRCAQQLAALAGQGATVIVMLAAMG